MRAFKNGDLIRIASGKYKGSQGLAHIEADAEKECPPVPGMVWVGFGTDSTARFQRWVVDGRRSGSLPKGEGKGFWFGRGQLQRLDPATGEPVMEGGAAK